MQQQAELEQAAVEGEADGPVETGRTDSGATSGAAVVLPLRLRLTALAILFLAVLGMAEGIARLAIPETWLLPIGETHVDRSDRMLWQNPFLLWEPRRGTYFDGGSTVHINALGFRGPDTMTVDKPADVWRVMVTGDSSAYGFGVEADATLSARLEALLTARFPTRRFEVINAAVPGWSTYQSLNMLEDRGWRMQPDLLLVANLFSDNNYDTFVDRELLRELAWQRRMSAIASTLDHIRLFRGTRSLYARLRPPVVETPKRVRVADRTEHFTGRRRVAIGDYAGNLERMIALASERGCAVSFLILANRTDVEQPGRDAPWQPYRKVMRSIAAKAGAPLADYPETVRVHRMEGADALFLDKMHPTVRGHQLMAETVVESIANNARISAILAGSATGGR